MPLDAVYLTALAGELRRGAVGSRVDRVHQPERDELILQLRSREGVKRLLLCASPNHPRVHFTAAPSENPAQPPMFCMLLRKHLVGGKLTGIVQPPAERVLALKFDCTDELGEPVEKMLVAEIMGRNSNLILCGGDGRIVDCLRRVDFEMSEKRQVLPGLFYQSPPSQDKEDPASVTPGNIAALLSHAAGPLERWITGSFAGLSPLLGRELAYGFAGDVSVMVEDCDREKLCAYLIKELAGLTEGPFTPVLLLKDGQPKDFSCRPIGQYGGYYEQETGESFSALLDRFYAQRDRAERTRQKSQAMRRTVQNLRDRTARKLAHQRKELQDTEGRERLRQLGDVVTANLHRIGRGQGRLTCVDFYDPEMREIEIPLSPKLSPQQNAAKFYKDYTKAKNASRVLTGLIAQGEKELSYLESILDELNRAEGEKDLSEIRAELTEGGYIRSAGKKKQPKQQPSRPMAFRSSEGFEIYVGRNNRQNDQLTLRAAEKYDLWLHAQKIHGSHVIVACAGRGEPGEATLDEAAALAAWYSQAREGQNVPVDCALVKHVKKPAGAKPGMVIYDHYTTRYVTPDGKLCEKLREERQ